MANQETLNRSIVFDSNFCLLIVWPCIHWHLWWSWNENDCWRVANIMALQWRGCWVSGCRCCVKEFSCFILFSDWIHYLGAYKISVEIPDLSRIYPLTIIIYQPTKASVRVTVWLLWTIFILFGIHCERWTVTWSSKLPITQYFNWENIDSSTAISPNVNFAYDSLQSNRFAFCHFA